MSGAGQAVPAAQPADFSTLTEAAVLMQEAALEAGVERGTPLGVWVQAMAASMIAFGETAAEQRYAITNSLHDGRALVEAELQRVRETERLARTAIEEAKHARIVTELEKEQVIREMTRNVSSGVISTVVDVVTARARLYERRDGLLSWIELALLVLFLFVGGYALRMWQTPDAVTMLWRCEANWAQDPRGGRYCPERVLREIMPAVPTPAPSTAPPR